VINSAHSEHDIEECRNAEREFFKLARARHAKVALVQHLSLTELAGIYQIGYAANQQVAREENVPYVDDAEELRSELKSANSPFYSGDPLHPNRMGEEVLAHTLQRAVDRCLKSN
jgi:lysophospholipase L1-like esterase